MRVTGPWLTSGATQAVLGLLAGGGHRALVVGGCVRNALLGEPVPPDPTLDEQRACLIDHYRRVVERFGPVKGTILMRKYGCRYAQGLAGARQFRTRMAQVADGAEFCRVVEECFPRDA